MERYSDKVPDGLDSDVWSRQIGSALKKFLLSLVEGTNGLQTPGGDPVEIQAGIPADPGDSQAAATANHGHPIETATPSVPVGSTPDEGSGTALMRADARLALGIVTAQGETIGHDGSTAVALAAPTITRGGVFVLPTGASDVVVWRAPWPCTVTAVRGEMEGGTSADINARRNGVDEHLAADLAVAPGAWSGSTTIQNAAYVAGDSLELRLKAVVGTPDTVTVQVEFTRP